MSNQFSQTIVQGFLGGEPVMRYTPDGKAVVNFNLGCSEHYTTSSGQEVNSTVWYRVSAWGPRAENINKYCKKGSQVLVIGKLKGDENGRPPVYTTKEGKTYASFDLNATSVQFLDKRDSESTMNQKVDSVDDSDIPF